MSDLNAVMSVQSLIYLVSEFQRDMAAMENAVTPGLVLKGGDRRFASGVQRPRERVCSGGASR